MKRHLLSLLFCLAALASFAQERAAYPWRGVMIDVSRHFMPMDFLYRQVVAMHHFGLNTLHLHLCDAAGWRLEIKQYPRLTSLAAWRTAASWKEWWNDGRRHYVETRSLAGKLEAVELTGNDQYEHCDSAFGGFYTQEAMRQLVHFADSLGVQIVPEIEFPAHSEEVTAAYPQLGCTGRAYQCADFCLGNDSTYLFINKVLDELTTIFTSPYIHMGGDEAAGAHWPTCPKCQARMKELGITTPKQLQQYAMSRVAEMVDAKGRMMVAWDEALPEASADTARVKPVIMVWRDAATARQALRQGHDVVMCPGKWYYLDAYQDAPLHEPEAMGGYTPLEKVFKRPDLPKGVLGEQVNLWTEYVPDAVHAERMLWPRAVCLSPEAIWQTSMTIEPSSKTIELSPTTVGSSSKTCKDELQRAYASFRSHVLKEALPWLREQGLHPFPSEKEVGQRKEYDRPIRCLSTGKKVTYLSPYNTTYSAGGDSALTDGLRGGWANNDGRWQGFISRGRLNVIVDLEKVEKVRCIESTFLQSVGPEIYLPEHLRVEVSEDGEHYTLLYNKSLERSWSSVDYQTLGWRGKAKARFIHVQADCGNRGGWIFTDEIVVK